MSVVLMTGRNGGGGIASGGAIYDFTQMSAADLLNAGWTHSRDTAGYVPDADTIADVQVAGYFDNARARRDKPAAGDVIIASKVVDGVAIGAMLFVSKGDEHVAFEVGKLS